MTPKRFYFAMIAGILLLSLAIIGGALGVEKLLQAKSTQLVDLKAKQASYTQQQQSLARAKKDITAYTELYNIAKTIVPENKNQAETVLQIVKLAKSSNVSLGSITFPSSSLGSVAATSTTTTSNSLTPKVVAPNDAQAALSQLTPVAGSPGVYVMQITVSSDTDAPATYPQLLNFLAALERNRLTAEVTNINIIPSNETSNRFSFTLSLNTYIKP